MHRFYWFIGLATIIGAIFGFFTNNMLLSMPLGFLIGVAFFEKINKKK